MLEKTQFLRKYPQYAGVISRMEPIATNTVPVMAVALRRLNSRDCSGLLLLVNVAYFVEYPEYFAGVLLHEIHHVVCGHLSDEKFHRVANPRVMEVAMELTANESIHEALPKGGIHLKDFASFGIAASQSTLERYILLRRAVECGRLRMKDLWSAAMLDTHRPRKGGSRGAGLGDVLDGRADGASEKNWSGSDWGLGAPATQSTLDQMRERIQQHLRGPAGGADDQRLDPTQRRMAKELQRVLFDNGQSGLIDWARVLDEALPRRRLIRPDYVHPNRRFPTRVGEIPGRRRRFPKPHLLVAIDTSGSMQGEALDRIAPELRRLASHARVTVIECDSAVHRVYPLSRRLETVVGGGDTDFTPVFDEARRENGLDGIVYFTDGKGSQPSSSALPTVWALTHADPFQANFGFIVRVP